MHTSRRLLATAAALSFPALVHCTSASRSTKEAPNGDDAAVEAGRGDATSPVDADLDAGEASDAAQDSPFDARPPCVVRTSGTDAGVLDPTFSTFTWSPPASYSLAPSRFAKLAVAPGGDAYVAAAVSAPGASVNDSSYVAVMHVLASGAMDPAFGADGGVVTLSSWETVYDLIVDHNGDIVVTGGTPSSINTGGSFGLVALRGDGSTDFTVDPVIVGTGGESSPCHGCIADGKSGYLTPSATAMLSVSSAGVVSQTDTLPDGGTVNQCAMAGTASAVSLYCQFINGYGGEAMRFGLDGVRDPSFGSDGVFNSTQEAMYMPWAAADGSLFLVEQPNANGPDPFYHLLDDGTLDPTYADASTVPNTANTTFEVLYGGQRCDGTELFLEWGPAPSIAVSNLAMESTGATGPVVRSAGMMIMPQPDGSLGGYDDYAIDAHGAAVVLYQIGESTLELVRVLPSD